MRTRALSAALLCLLLATAPGSAWAQNVGPGQARTQSDQGDDQDNQPPGSVRQPTPESPGLVTGVTLGELHTDNLQLVGDSRPRQSDWVTVVEPFLKAAYGSPRFSMQMDLNLAGYMYSKHEQANQVSHDSQLQGSLAIIPDHLFLEGSGSYRRAIVDARAPAGSGSFFLTGNQANVASGVLSPYWIQQLGRVGSMTLRYSRGRVVYNRNGVDSLGTPQPAGIPGASSEGVNFSVVSPADETWGWNVHYDGERIQSDLGRDIRFETAKLGLSRQLGLHTRLIANGGRENKYLPNGDIDELGANFWNAGLQWADTRNAFKVLIGHRFYGRSAELDWTHHAARLTTRVSYQERPTDLNQQLLGQLSMIGMPPPGMGANPSLLEQRIYLMKRASAALMLEMPTSQLRLSLYNESRKYFLGNAGHEYVSDARLAWAFQLGPFTSLTPSIDWQRMEFLDGQVNFTRYQQLELVHRLSRNQFLSLRLRHGSRGIQSARPGEEGYKVNVVYLQWTWTF